MTDREEKSPVIRSGVSSETRPRITKWIVQSALGLLGYGLVLFLAAGRLDWLWGWALLIVLALVLAAHPLILIPINPGLLAERQKGLRDPRVRSWDRWVTGFAAGVFPVASWVVAGLDFRWGWTAPVPLSLHLSGLIIMVLGYAMFLWAMASNGFFAEGVRIQDDRGHTVATRGPYRFVRHPGYSGAILSQLATPALLGSAWAIVPSVASAALYILRTRLEDRTLMEELAGYKDYAGRTRRRLLPGIW
jgi:protein-S-isoprenylcysteine O-methyltransferase Ste14